MKVTQLKRLTIANAVSAALFCSASVQADEQLVDAKFILHNEQLLVNSIYQEDTKTSAEVDLLTAVEMLPVECDVISVYPEVELYINNPNIELVGSWTAEDIEFAEQADAEEEEQADETDESEQEYEDDLEGEEDEDEDDDEDDEDEDENDDEDEDDEDEDDDEDEESDDEYSEQESQFLTISFDGYIVFTELLSEAGIATCNSTYIGELNGDTYTPSASE